MIALFVAACVENAVLKLDSDGPPAFDSGTTPVDTATETTPTDTTTTPPPRVAPLVDITSPEGPVPGCVPVQLQGVVSDDGPVADLSVQWFRDGVPDAYAVPGDDGRVTLDVAPEAAAWELRAVDTDGLTGADRLDLEVEGFDPATWDLAATWERSAMDDRVSAAGIGACLADAAALPTSTSLVWDDGVYTPSASAADGITAGRSWASWDQVGTDCHLFRLRVQIPTCPFTELRVSSPWYEGVPINDNLYVLVGGVELVRDGTSYGVGYGGPAEVDTYLMEPVRVPSGWLTPGTENEILFVTEEYAAWGGMGMLEAELVP